MSIEAESLVESSDWAKATVRFQELQKAWEESGSAPRDAGRELSQRFRAASNAFFTRRREDLASRKKVWTENLAKKEELCARADALAESTEWEAASAEFKRMQAEWKTVGPVRRNKSEAVWNRFRAAADKFFERFHNRHQLALLEQAGRARSDGRGARRHWPPVKRRLPISPTRVQQLRTTWNRAVPIPAPEAKVLADRWQATLLKLAQTRAELFKGTELDAAAAHQRLEKLLAKVEAHLEDDGDDEEELSPTEALAARAAQRAGVECDGRPRGRRIQVARRSRAREGSAGRVGASGAARVARSRASRRGSGKPAAA